MRWGRSYVGTLTQLPDLSAWDVQREPQSEDCGSFFALFNSEASLYRLYQSLPLVFEPLEYPDAIDMEMEFNYIFIKDGEACGYEKRSS